MTEPLYAACESFASPIERPPLDLVAHVALGWAETLVQRFLERAGSAAFAAAPDLAAFLISWPGSQPAATAHTRLWCDPFGDVDQWLKQPDNNVLELSVRVGLCLAMNGHQGSWRAAGLRMPRLLLGAHAIGPISEVAVDAREGKPTVRVRGERLEIFSRTDRSSDVGLDEAASGPLVWNDLALLSQTELGGVSHGFDAGAPIPALTEDVLVTFTEGTALIDRNMHEYRAWVLRLIRQILVLKAEDSFRMVSGSGEQAPGLIHISYPISPPEVAEILIHEASHQYFYLLEKLGPLDDGSDPQGYWSPPIRRH